MESEGGFLAEWERRRTEGFRVGGTEVDHRPRVVHIIDKPVVHLVGQGEHAFPVVADAGEAMDTARLHRSSHILAVPGGIVERVLRESRRQTVKGGARHTGPGLEQFPNEGRARLVREGNTGLVRTEGSVPAEGDPVNGRGEFAAAGQLHPGGGREAIAVEGDFGVRGHLGRAGWVLERPPFTQ